jgi:hypothetical protein
MGAGAIKRHDGVYASGEVGVNDIPSYRKPPILPKWEMLTYFCCLALAQQAPNRSKKQEARSKKARTVRQNAYFCYDIPQDLPLMFI